MIKSKFFSALIIILIALNSYGEVPSFKLTQDKDTHLYLDIELKDYKTYWLYSSASGIPTNIDLSDSENLEKYKVIWPFPHIAINKGAIDSYYYQSKLKIPIYVKAKDINKVVSIKAKLTYLLCNDQCIPVVQKIEENVVDNYAMHKLLNSFIASNVKYQNDYLTFFLRFSTPAIDNIQIAIDQIDKDFVDSTIINKINDTTYFAKLAVSNENYELIKNKNFDIYTNHTELPSNISIPAIINYQELNIIAALFFAFFGGFILNFMPCVLPVLSLKLLSLTKQKNSKLSFFWIFIGIITSFFALALLSILLKLSGKQFGLGIHFQNPEFIIFLTLTLTVFISSCLGRMNITLPVTFTIHVDAFKSERGYVNDFFAGILATILSTPCTAPFLGTAIAFALGGDSYITIIIIFILTGFGFAAPYIILMCFPHLTSYLPKSGKWMELIKLIMALLLIVTLLWLCNILYTQIGARAVIGLFMILLLLKFIIETQTGSFANNKLKLFSAICLIVGAMYLPNMAHKEDIQHENFVNSIWQNFDQSKITNLIESDRIVLVDVTASWCAACRFNKILLWDRDDTVRLLKKNNVIAMRADYTKNSIEIYEYLLSNNSYGIPFSIIYSKNYPNGIILPIITFFSDLENALKTIHSK